MSARKQADKKSLNVYIIPALILGIVFISTLISFGYNMINNAKEQVEKDYQSEVNSVCQLYEKEIYAVEKETELISNYLCDLNEIINEDNINYLSNAVGTIGAENAYIIRPDFSAIDISGREYDNLEEECPVYVDVFAKKTKALVYANNKDEKVVTYIVKPISTKTLLRGYVAVEFIPKIMDTLLDNPKYSARKSYAFMSSEGVLIDAAGGKGQLTQVGENVLEIGQRLTFTDGSYSTFKQSIRDLRSGSAKVIDNGKGEYIYFSPIKGSKAGVMMLVSTEDVDKTFATVSKNIRSMLLEVGITILVFFMVIAGISFFNKAKYHIESEDLQNKADTDLLTELYNKMATERLIKEYLEGEGKNSISMLFVLDVDNFKKINDTMGHAFGDQVLSQLGHQIRAWFRVNDIVGRIGGDEFMVFIKDVKDPEVVKREGSRIMQFFEGFNVGEYTRYSPTASVGGAVYPNDGNDFESLYKAADKAVYKSKKEGKNRVSFYGDLNTTEKDTAED